MRPRSSHASGLLSKATFVLPLLVYASIYFADGTAFHPNGDGYYSWTFARSLAFDGDLDFTNDYALCGDPFGVGLVRGGGHPDNPFYVGPAVFWLAPLFVLRGLFTLVHGGHGAAVASCGGWLTALTLLAGPACGALTVWLSFQAARLFVPARVAMATALFFAFSSPLFPYSTSAAHYSHVYLACVVAGVTYVSLRAIARGPARRDGLWLFVTMTIAVLHRLPAALYLAVPIAAFVALALRGRPPWTALFGSVLGVVAGVALTLLLYQYLYGTWRALPQGPHYVHLAHAHPWLLLFGVHGGFFFWMPAAWLAVIGAGIALRRTGLRLLVLALLAAAAVEVFVSSAPLDWHGNWSLGARRLVPLTPFVIVLASHAVGRVLRGRRSAYVAAAAVALVLVNNIPASTTIRGDRELTQRSLYGALSPFAVVWSAADGAGIDVALLPAELYFTARYRLPTRAYRTVLTPWYRRDFLTLEAADEELDLRRPGAAARIAGPSSERGMHVSAEESRVVFATEWPFATHARLLVENEQPVRLTIAAGRLLGRTPIGTIDVPSGARWVEIAMPANAYDSGINEWILQTEGGPAVVRALGLEDRTRRVPHGVRRERPSTPPSGSATRLPLPPSP